MAMSKTHQPTHLKQIYPAEIRLNPTIPTATMTKNVTASAASAALSFSYRYAVNKFFNFHIFVTYMLYSIGNRPSNIKYLTMIGLSPSIWCM
jgi:hypothetical protein